MILIRYSSKYPCSSFNTSTQYLFCLFCSFLALCVAPITAYCTDLNDIQDDQYCNAKSHKLNAAVKFHLCLELMSAVSCHVCKNLWAALAMLSSLDVHERIIYKALVTNNWHSVHWNSFVKQDHSQNEVCSCKFNQ